MASGAGTATTTTDTQDPRRAIALVAPVRPSLGRTESRTGPVPDRVAMRARMRTTDNVRAVVFDFFGTVAWPREGGAGSGVARVYESHGYRFDPDLERQYFLRYDGIEHLEHSVDRETYEAWSRFRVGELARDCGVAPEHIEALVDDVRALDTFGIVAYPDAVPTMRELRAHGYLVAICSNWGWDLDLSLAQAGLTEHLDGAVTSARAGPESPTLGSSPSPSRPSGSRRRRCCSWATPCAPTSRAPWPPGWRPSTSPGPTADAGRLSPPRSRRGPPGGVVTGAVEWPELAGINPGPAAAPH